MDFIIDRPVAFNREYKTITKSTNAALMLSQLSYWWKRKKGETIYKTISEFEDETGLSREEQDTAIKKLKSLNIITVELKGIPATRHFTINERELLKLLNQVCGVTANCDVGLPQTNTEITTDTSTKVEGVVTPPKPKTNSIKGDVFAKARGDVGVSKIVESLTELMPTKKLDGSDKENRRRAHNLIQKYGLDAVLATIKVIPKIPFWHDKVTSCSSLLKHYNAITNSLPKMVEKYITL